MLSLIKRLQLIFDAHRKHDGIENVNLVEKIGTISAKILMKVRPYRAELIAMNLTKSNENQKVYFC
jgi:hypothetical protein